MNIECQVPNCRVGSFSKGESFKRICQKHFHFLLNNLLDATDETTQDTQESIEINSVEDIKLDVEYSQSVLKKSLKLCLEELSRRAKEVQNLRDSLKCRTQDAKSSDESSPDAVTLCPICGKKFKNKYRMNFHVKTVHGSVRQFMCQHCGATFKRRDGLTVHEMNNHPPQGNAESSTITQRNKKSFQCHLCSKSLSTQANLRGHLKSFHTRERPHLCRSCGKSYATLAALRTHEKFHSMPFSCKICGKSFPDASRFDDHMMGHTEVYLKCSVCAKKFSHRNSLRIHQKLHDVGTRREYKCDFCAASFSLKSYLQKHIQRCKKKTH